jgi:hypothetical protein
MLIPNTVKRGHLLSPRNNFKYLICGEKCMVWYKHSEWNHENQQNQGYMTSNTLDNKNI